MTGVLAGRGGDTEMETQRRQACDIAADKGGMQPPARGL